MIRYFQLHGRRGACPWVFGFVLIVLAGCRPVEERCRDIWLDELIAEAAALREERFNRDLFDRLPTDYTQEQYRMARRQLRAEYAQDLRERMLAQRPQDSLAWAATPEADSADPEPSPPPTPSQREWYSERCWEGKAR